MKAEENKRSKNPHKKQVEGIAAVSLLANRINASLDLQETLDAVVSEVVKLVPCSLAEIDLWDEQHQMLILQSIQSTSERSFPVGEVFPPGKGYTGWVVNNRQSLLVSDVDAYTGIQPDILPGELPFKSYVGLPLLAGEHLIGALVLVHDRTGAFDGEDLQLLEAIASQAATAINNARIFQKLDRQHKEIAALFSVASAINNARNLQELLNNALDSIVKVTAATAAAVRLMDKQQNRLSFAASKGLSEEFIALIQPVRLGEGVTGAVALHGEPALITDMLARPISDPVFRSALFQAGIRSRLEVPLHSHQHVVGTLGIASGEIAAFAEDDVVLLTAIGQQLGVAVDNEHLRQEALRKERLAAVGRVAMGVAHDLRSPLGGILRSAEFLSRPEISPKTREKLCRSIISPTRRLINTAQEILDYINGEKLALHFESVHLNEFLDEVLDVMQVDFSDLGIEVVKNYRYDGMIVIDPDRMAQVAYNLLSNARDAMSGGGKFTLNTLRKGDQIEIHFSDTGKGIPAEITTRIFEPFYSFGKKQGAGLGLAISQQIVKEHGGIIRLASNKDQGTSFIVSLPL
jgi:signal transduction histidine kinase